MLAWVIYSNVDGVGLMGSLSCLFQSIVYFIDISYHYPTSRDAPHVMSFLSELFALVPIGYGVLSWVAEDCRYILVCHL